MKWLVDMTVRLLEAVQQISTRKWSFLLLSLMAFGASVAGLAWLDLLPEAPAVAEPGGAVSQTAVTPTSVALPVLIEVPTKIEIPKIKLSTVVENPTTTDIESLDKELLKGAVRYPTSAQLGANGNVVLFGHSSYLPVVLNKAYQAFNDIQKLAVGDTVTVYSATTAYIYRVRTVAKESTVDAAIPLQVDGRVLTLSTCDSFGATTDRFVVTADFVESHPLSADA